MTDSLFTRLQHALAPAFELERELHGGGMSRVFVATERALARRVVIKLLPPDLAAGVNTERFRREIQLAAGLHHPHIVPLLSAGEVDGLLYYTMPFIEGESLRERLAAKGRSSPRDVVRILHDVVDALAYAHRRGIVHRDIKPGNILTLGTHALVTDFGVAKALSAALPVSGLTTGGIAIGSPAYMAPEQLAGDPTADHRMDIYAVGLLAYELLAGESPFTGPSPQATMAAQLTRMPEPIDRIRSDVPASLAAILTRCLQKAPSARYPTADALLADLERVELPGGITAAIPVVRPRRVSVAFIAVALLTAAAAGMAANVILRPDRSTAIALDTVADDVPPSVVLVDTAARSAAVQERVITRAESLAIAQRIREQMGADAAAAPRAPNAPQSAERAAVDLERVILDSVRIAIETMKKMRIVAPTPPAVPPPGTHPRASVHAAPLASAAAAAQVFGVTEGKRLVAVEELANSTGRGELRDVARQLSDSLRVAIDRHDRFVLVPRIPRTAVRVGSASAPAVVPGYTVAGMIFLHDGRLTQLLRITDQTGRTVGIINGPLAPVETPLASSRELLEMAIAQMERLSDAPTARGPLVSTSPSRAAAP